ncbi:hypothetical protein NMY22_g15606 [Coprinellus aureogranulatus]|nr:hypothetical protein NMY22_g15606 [Coprinellus aureogranulatus]
MPFLCGLGHKLKTLFRKVDVVAEPSSTSGKLDHAGYPDAISGVDLPVFGPASKTGQPQPSDQAPPAPPQLTFTPSLSPPIPPTPEQQLVTSPLHTPLSNTNHFPNAHDFSISRVSIDHSSNTVNHYGSTKALFEYLEPHISYGAAHDSDERCDAPKCAPETREAVQGDMFSFISQGDGEPKKLMWLGGPAGSGKTAITGSVAEACKQGRILAASFFFSSFSGSADRYSKRCVVPTLAHHLAKHDCLSGYKLQLQASIERNPDIFRKHLREQAECLILGPLRMTPHDGNRSTWPKGIILDGLDESARFNEDDQLEILEMLLTLANCPAFPFRIVVASRPERIINEFFATAARASTVALFLDSRYMPDDDIERFLKSKFAGIRRRSGMSDVSWPSQEVIDRIVEMSSGQFIVPATVIRYVESGLPRRQLEDVMRVQWDETRTKNPFAVLDALYTHILNRSPDPHLAVKWVSCITAFHKRKAGGWVEPVPAIFWRHFLEDTEGELNYLLMPLTSLLSIPLPEDQEAPITIYHKSLTDFLSSKNRCGELYLGPDLSRSFATDRCLNILKSASTIPLHILYKIDWLMVDPASDKGPSISLSSGYDMSPFIVNFLSLCPLVCATMFREDMKEFIPFILHLDEKSKSDLASCDVAWWTRRLLTARLSEG